MGGTKALQAYEAIFCFLLERVLNPVAHLFSYRTQSGKRYYLSFQTFPCGRQQTSLFLFVFKDICREEEN